LNSGKGGPYARVAGDVIAAGLERNIEIRADKHGFVFQIKIFDRQFRH
jgi:hypothetical protein